MLSETVITLECVDDSCVYVTVIGHTSSRLNISCAANSACIGADFACPSESAGSCIIFCDDDRTGGDSCQGLDVFASPEFAVNYLDLQCTATAKSNTWQICDGIDLNCGDDPSSPRDGAVMCDPF